MCCDRCLGASLCVLLEAEEQACPSFQPRDTPDYPASGSMLPTQVWPLGVHASKLFSSCSQNWVVEAGHVELGWWKKSLRGCSPTVKSRQLGLVAGDSALTPGNPWGLEHCRKTTVYCPKHSLQETRHRLLGFTGYTTLEP